MALMKKLTSAIVASSLVLGLVGTVGATTPDKVQTAADRMLKLHMINGVTPGTTDLALSANLTRAQLVTILVRAFGQEGNAKYLNGAAAFPDTANHPWASGYIAMAKRIIADRSASKETVGMPDGTFNPDGNVTAAEAVAFLMKFVGAPKDDTLAWPDNYIEGAAKAGLITAEDKAVLMGVKNAPATRGLAFYLADRTFYGYKLVEGGTVYTTFVDSVKPNVTVDAVPATTLEDKVIVTGTVTDDTVAVHVGTMDNSATIANGKFTATVNLKVGENSILVHALDLAGNPFEQTVKVTRTVGNAASIEAADFTVAAGATADVKAVVKDAKGNEITGATVTGESTIGKFADGKFTAGEKAGAGKLTLKVGEFTKDVTVTVSAGDLAKVGADKPSAAPGERITLTAQDQYGNAISGATFSVDSQDALVDSTKGTFIGAKSGTYTVTAKVGDKTATLKVGVFADAQHLVINAPASLIANDQTTATVTVNAVDVNGNIVGSYNGMITLSGDGLIQDGNLSLNPTVQAKNGVATFTIMTKNGQAAAGGIIPLTATATDLVDATGELQATGQVATSVGFYSTPTYVAATSAGIQTAKIQARVLDQAGKKMLTGTYNVSFSLTGPGYFTDANNANNGAALSNTIAYVAPGQYATTFVKAKAGITGDIVVTATVAGIGSQTATVKSVVPTNVAGVQATVDATTNPGTAGQFVVDATHPTATGTPVTVTLQLVDTNGVPMPGNGTTSVYVSSDKDDTSIAQLQVTQEVTSNQALVATNTVTILGADAGGKKVQSPVTFDNVTGQATLTVKAQNLTGDINLTVKDFASSPLNGTTAKVTFDANIAAQYKVVQPGYYLAVGKTESVAAVQLYDEAGNKAKVSGKGVVFTKSDAPNISGITMDGTSKKQVTAYTDANGVATIKVALPNGAGIYDNAITAQPVDAYPVIGTSDVISYTVGFAVPTNMTARVGVLMPATPGSTPTHDYDTFATKYTAGNNDSVQLFVQVKDNFNSFMDAGTLTSSRIHLDDASALLVNPTGTAPVLFTYNETLKGWVSDTFKVPTSGLNSLKVVTDDATVVATGRISIAAGAATAVVVKEAYSVPGTDTTKHVRITKDTLSNAFTVELRDANNNPVINSSATATPITVSASQPTGGYFEVRTSAGGRNILTNGTTGILNVQPGSSSVTFYLLGNPGSGTTATFSLQIGNSTAQNFTVDF